MGSEMCIRDSHRTLLDASISENSHISIEDSFSVNIDDSDLPCITTFEGKTEEPWKIEHIIRALIENMGYVLTLEEPCKSVREETHRTDRFVFHAKSMSGKCRIQIDVKVDTELKYPEDDLENNIEESKFFVKMKIWAESVADGQRMARDIEQNLTKRITERNQ